MEDEVLRYKQQLEQRLADKPIWEKKCLTVKEAAAYSGIGTKKIRELIKLKKCPFVLSIGTQLYIVREKLDEYTNAQYKI